MTLHGQVINSYEEVKTLQGRDGGAPRQARVFHVLLMTPADPKAGIAPEVYNIVSYDPAYELPKIGTDWRTPRIRSLECTGDVAEVRI